MVTNIVRCTFHDDHVEVPDGINKWLLYKFMQEAIYDAHLPVTKVIGFALHTTTKIYGQTATERCSYCMENMIEISSNLKDIIFTYNRNSHIVNEQKAGEICITDDDFTSSTDKVDKLFMQPYILTAIKPLYIELFAIDGFGYRTMDDNSKLMKNSKYFPMNSYHTLYPYVRLLPYDGNIRYKLSHGLKANTLYGLFAKLCGLYTSGDLERGEAEWASAFQQ